MQRIIHNYVPVCMYTIGMQVYVIQKKSTWRKQRVIMKATVRETEEQRVRRRVENERIATAAYMQEREYMRQKHEDEKIRSGLVIGSLVYVDVAKQLRKSRVQWYMRRIPAVIVNIVKDDTLYQVKAKSSLIKTLIRRDAMLVVHNDALRIEIDESAMKDAKGLDLENYRKSMWLATDSRPICSCRGKCDTNKCPCRVKGFRCGTDCHSKAYYAKHTSF